jgi:UDP-glucose 4-epimerase
MKVLITGCHGFVGGSVGGRAARAGHEVLGVGRSSQPPAGWPGRYVPGDILSLDLSGVVGEFAPEVVLHAAGTASVGGSIESPLDDLRAGVLTWANTLDGVRRSGLRPLVLFPSSAAVYGDPARLPVDEAAPINPVSPYGFHKAACELLAREYADCYGLRVIVCRLFSVFGPGQRRLLVWELYRQFKSPTQTVWLQGTGRESRDYLHVDDVADAILRLATPRTAWAEPGQWHAINVASGAETRVLDVASQVRDLIAPGREVRCRGDERPGDPPHWRADVTRLRSLIPSWEPQHLTAALARCVDAWQKESSAPRHGD